MLPKSLKNHASDEHVRSEAFHKRFLRDIYVPKTGGHIHSTENPLFAHSNHRVISHSIEVYGLANVSDERIGISNRRISYTMFACRKVAKNSNGVNLVLAHFPRILSHFLYDSTPTFVKQ